VAPFSHDPPGFNPRGRKHDKSGGFRFHLGTPILYLGLVVLGLPDVLR
jgi:hypothetical protein